MREEAVNLFLRLRQSAASRARRALFNALGARIRGGRLCRVSIPRNPWDIEIDDAALDDDVVLLTTGARLGRPRIRIDRGVYINRFTMLDASHEIWIQAGAMIGPQCYITDHDHGTCADASISSQPLKEAPVLIGADAWLGAGVIVLKGVTIGAGAVVGAGSVVTRDVAPGAVVAGSPPRTLRARA